MINDFNFICIEGADKCGKTTLSNEIKRQLSKVDLQYWHFTACNKPKYSDTDIPLQRDVSVMYQFYKFFNEHFYSKDAKLATKTYLLDRTLYSDIVYGPIYRGADDQLMVRQLEFNYFTLMLMGLGAVLIHADNSDIDFSYDAIRKENEGMIKTKNEYVALRESYRNMMSKVIDSSDLTVLHYDFNTMTTTDFIHTELIPTLRHQYSTFRRAILHQHAFGEILGNIDLDADVPVYMIEPAPPFTRGLITLQDYANLVIDTGMHNLSVSSPVIKTNKLRIMRARSAADITYKNLIFN